MSPTPTPEPMTPEQRVLLVAGVDTASMLESQTSVRLQDMADAVREHAAHATAAASVRIAELERERDTEIVPARISVTPWRKGWIYSHGDGRMAWCDGASEDATLQEPATPLARAEREMQEAGGRYALASIHSRDSSAEFSAMIRAARAYDALLSARDGKGYEDDETVEAAMDAAFKQNRALSDPVRLRATCEALLRAGLLRRPAQEVK